jgi:hypothetical protein
MKPFHALLNSRPMCGNASAVYAISVENPLSLWRSLIYPVRSCIVIFDDKRIARFPVRIINPRLLWRSKRPRRFFPTLLPGTLFVACFGGLLYAQDDPRPANRGELPEEKIDRLERRISELEYWNALFV